MGALVDRRGSPSRRRTVRRRDGGLHVGRLGVGTLREYAAGGRLMHIEPVVVKRCLQAAVDQIGKAGVRHPHKLTPRDFRLHR
ncbi:hypothetical protein RLIN73S_03581 [Rhodanobacter lindaniclasticus]